MGSAIRLARESDAENVAAVYAPYVRETAISFELEPPPPDEMRQRIRTTLAQGCWLVWEQDAAVVGYAYAGRFHARAAYQWTVETTVYVDRDHHRRGVGRGLYTALLGVLRAQGYRSAVGVIALPNAPSVGLHEGLGFRPAGLVHAVGYKHGRWHDIGWWQLALDEQVGSPAAPRAVDAVVDTPAWRGAVAAGARLVRG
jgi:phosphinothricin acetyltransferase